jgi:glutamate dehydrogenase (NAD(P)+)
MIGLDCDIWIPAARPDVFTADNAEEVRARLILQGANIPATAGAETAFHRRGVVSIPDFIANAGGVICAAVEYAGGTAGQAFQAIEEKIRANTSEVLERSRASGTEPRVAAEAIAQDRVREAMGYRRRF